MPDSLSLSSGVSLGLLAGIVSGVCYIMANGLTWPRLEPRKRCVTLSREEGVCPKCWGDRQGGALPCICDTHQPVKFEHGAWFLRQAQKALTLMPWSLSTDKLEQIDEECEGSDGAEGRTERGDLRSVREFLESLSARLAGGSLDRTRVAPLYDHPAYLPSRHENQASISNPAPSSASSAHAQLKRLVARVVEEAAALPALARYAAEPPRAPSVEASTYEDLLATAILNKVIERYQTENGSGGRSSGIHSASASPTPSERSSPRSLNSRHQRDETPPLLEEDEDVTDWEEGEATDDALELPRRVPFPEFGGDIIHGTEEDRLDFDEVSGSDIQAADGSWEENWLFQKKKIKSLQSVPVPMLVPNSNTEYRAMIGDRDADDTTDLSDNASDSEEEQNKYKSDIQRVLDSKHVIGGKSKIEEVMDFEPDSLTILDDVDEEGDDNVIHAINDVVDGGNITKLDTINGNLVNDIKIEDKESILILGIDSGPLRKTEFNMNKEIHRTVLNESDSLKEGHAEKQNIETLNVKEDFERNRELRQNTLNGHEREGEYEETVTVPVQRYADSLRRKHFDDVPQIIPTRDTDRDDDLIPGSIADRERKKWLNYVEMPNNPYSPEAIQKRLMAKSTSSLFDTMTKSKEFDEMTNTKTPKEIRERNKKLDMPVKDDIIKQAKSEQTLNIQQNYINGHRSKSPSPKILQDVLAEEVPQYKRYGRDYYIKEAKVSSGGRKKSNFSETSSISSMNKSTSLDNFDTEFASTGLLIKQFNTIATNQQYTTFSDKYEPRKSITIISDSNNTQNILIEYEDVNEQTLFSAKPALVDDDTDRKFEEILQSAYNSGLSSLNVEADNKTENDSPKSPINTSLDNSFLSTSSLEDSIKIYNVQTGEIVKCKPVDNVSQRYDEKPDKNDNIDIPDKNSGTETFSQVNYVNGESVVADGLGERKLVVIEEFEEIQLPKVKELAQKFVSMENLNETVSKPPHLYWRRKSKENLLNGTDKPPHKQAYMHSLTARSISKEFREELKLSMAIPLKVPGGANEVPEGIEEVSKESSRPGSPVPEPGTIKTKLAFFESLKSKFSTK